MEIIQEGFLTFSTFFVFKSTPTPTPDLNILFKKIYLFVLFVAVLGLRCCVWASSGCGEPGLFSSCGAWASPWTSLFGAQALGLVAFSSCSSEALEHRLSSCGTGVSLACGVFSDQGSNPCPSHCKVDS